MGRLIKVQPPRGRVWLVGMRCLLCRELQLTCTVMCLFECCLSFLLAAGETAWTYFVGKGKMCVQEGGEGGFLCVFFAVLFVLG